MSLLDPISPFLALIDRLSSLGNSGTDGQLNLQLERLQRELKEETYQPLPVRQHPIPKRDKPGQYRLLGIPAIYDRVCEQALLIGSYAPRAFYFGAGGGGWFSLVGGTMPLRRK